MTLSRYLRPAALMWGDPHFVTFDGLVYTFNGIGEYTMVTLRDGSFRVQARTVQMLNSHGEPVDAAAFAAFAAEQAGGARVQAEISADRTGKQRGESE